MRRALSTIAAMATAGAGAWLLFAPAEAQTPESTPPEPLYAGVDSIGARPKAQPASPALYFEAKVHWPSLGIETPRTAWEYAQRGIYRQDALEDEAGAVEDYLAAEALDDHLLIVQARLAYLALERGRSEERAGRAVEAEAAYAEALDRYDRVLHEQPDRQGLRLRVAAANLGRARTATAAAASEQAAAEAALCDELALAPTQQEAFYLLAGLYEAQGRAADARRMYRAYLEEAERRGDPYPWKLSKARRYLGE